MLTITPCRLLAVSCAWWAGYWAALAQALEAPSERRRPKLELVR